MKNKLTEKEVLLFEAGQTDGVIKVLGELYEAGDRLRKEPTLCGNCNPNGDLCVRCYGNRQANSTLDKFLCGHFADVENGCLVCEADHSKECKECCGAPCLTCGRWMQPPSIWRAIKEFFKFTG